MIKTTPTILKGLGFLALGLLFCSWGFWLIVRPTQYEAVAKLQEPVQSAFPQTSFEVIKSDWVLDLAATNQNLNEALGIKLIPNNTNELAAIVHQLRRGLQLTAASSNGLAQIDIGFIRRKPDEAATIATAVAQAYKQFRFCSAIAWDSSEVQWFENEIKQQQKKCDAARQAISDSGQPFPAENPQPLGGGMPLEKEYKFMLLQFDYLKKLNAQQLRDTLPVASPDTKLQYLSDQLNDLRMQALVGSQTLVGTNTNSVNSSLETKIHALAVQIDNRITDLLDQMKEDIAKKTAFKKEVSNRNKSITPVSKEVQVYYIMCAQLCHLSVRLYQIADRMAFLEKDKTPFIDSLPPIVIPAVTPQTPLPRHYYWGSILFILGLMPIFVGRRFLQNLRQ